jgi:hypothetical protein
MPLSRVLFTISLIFISIGLLAQSGKAIIIENKMPGSKNWNQGVFEIPWQQVLQVLPNADTSKLVVQDAKGNHIPYQAETKGTGNIVNLLVQVTVPTHQSLILSLSHGKKAAQVYKTFARYVPERYEDFAWENDKIAFRAYGKALESTNENAWGIDVWSKRTEKLIINKWYRENDYHKDHGEGLDYYKVGFTLGAGSIAAFHADTICYPANYTKWEILDNGPLRTTFRLHHDAWKAGPATVSMVRELSIDAGAQLYSNRVTFNVAGAINTMAAVGIRKNPGADVVLLNQKEGWMGYWNPEESSYGTIGVGSVFPGTKGSQTVTKDHILFTETITNGTILVYHTGAAWDKAGEITTAEEWFAYLQQAATQPLPIVKIKNN